MQSVLDKTDKPNITSLLIAMEAAAGPMPVGACKLFICKDGYMLVERKQNGEYLVTSAPGAPVHIPFRLNYFEV